MNLQNFLFGVSAPFLMNEAGGDGGGEGAGAATGGEAGDAGAGTATDDGTGGKAPFGQTPDGEGGQGEGEGEASHEKPLDLKALLGEDLSGDQNISKFLDTENPVQEMAKSLLEAQKQIGKPKIGVPSENATDEERSAFWQELGVPENAEGYAFERPENVPEEMYDAEHANKWAQLLHENNIPAEAANNLRNAMFEEAAAEQAASVEALNSQLTEYFGDNKDAKIKQIAADVTKAIPDEAERLKVQEALKNDAALALVVGKVNDYYKKRYGMSDQNTGDESGESGKSLDELRTEAKNLMASDAYRDAMHKDHSSVKKQVNDMYKEIGQLTTSVQKK